MNGGKDMKRMIAGVLLGTCICLTGCGNAASATVSTAATAAGKTAEASTAAAGNTVTSEAAQKNADRYKVCTGIAAETVESFAAKIQTAILTQDWDTLAQNCAYPITVSGTAYSSAEDLKAADITLDEKYLAAVKSAAVTNMFANAQGIMMGSGEVWISEVLDAQMKSEGLKVIALNVDQTN